MRLLFCWILPVLGLPFLGLQLAPSSSVSLGFRRTRFDPLADQIMEGGRARTS
jgi:hypothetical protein